MWAARGPELRDLRGRPVQEVAIADNLAQFVNLAFAHVDAGASLPAEWAWLTILAYHSSGIVRVMDLPLLVGDERLFLTGWSATALALAFVVSLFGMWQRVEFLYFQF